MTPIERVARALYPDWWRETHFDEGWQRQRHVLDNYQGQHERYRESSLKMARAAIEALREPSRFMQNEVTYYVEGERLGPLDAESIWQQMIDAALAEGDGK